MWVVLIHEQDGSHNLIGPFWHRDAADLFVRDYVHNPDVLVCEVTDRDKWTHR